jgi:Uma2 family endonuclease
MSEVATRPVTAEELLRLPRGEKRYELIEGELREMTPAGFDHGAVAGEISALLHRHVTERGLGRAVVETGFLLSRNPDTVRAPDAAFVSRERLERTGSTPGYWPGAPDLAVEVVSPHDTYSEVAGKALRWLEAGCRLVLVADPSSRRVTLYRPGREATTLDGDQPVDCSAVVAGFAPPARGLFA